MTHIYAAVILIDSNIPMYLVGAPHALKVESQKLLEQAALSGERLVTDAEVFQEILHRYVAIRRRDAIQPAFDLLHQVVDEVFPIELEDVRRAKEVVLATGNLSARDAVHLAVMERGGVETILSLDRGFDQVPDITRIGG